MENISDESATRIELDRNSKNLLFLWKNLNQGQQFTTQLGKIDTDIITAALTTGLRHGKIEIEWQNEKKPSTPQITTDAASKTVRVSLDRAILTALEREVETTLMPGGVFPPVENPTLLISGLLKKLPPEKKTGLANLPPINTTVIEIYNHYLKT